MLRATATMEIGRGREIWPAKMIFADQKLANRALRSLGGALAHRYLLVHPAITAILLMFHAMVTSVHSPRTEASPRNRNWRKRITDLMMPNTGSTVCLRKP